MKVVEAKSARYLGIKCRACPRQVVKGQVVIVDRVDDARFGQRDYVVHVDCMNRLVATAPPDRDERAFEALRDRILEERTPFPQRM